MTDKNPLGLIPFDVTDFLTSEEDIAAFLEAAQENLDEFATPIDRDAHLQQVQDDVARARLRWGLRAI